MRCLVADNDGSVDKQKRDEADDDEDVSVKFTDGTDDKFPENFRMIQMGFDSEHEIAECRVFSLHLRINFHHHFVHNVHAQSSCNPNNICLSH